MTAVQALIAEDDPVSRNLLERVLSSWGYEVVVTCNGEEAWGWLQLDEAPPIVILDWMMPDLDGLEVCRRVRALGLPAPPYIILLSARDGKSDIVEGLNAGANDYVGKPFDRGELRARLEVGRRFVELNRELLGTQRTLEIQARIDSLTGCMNRRAILERLEEEMARTERQGSLLGVGLIDIDRFKLVNDTFGHATGDDVLREFVSRSMRAMRAYDALGRFGGEEFLVVVPGADSDETEGVLERIRLAICSAPIVAEGNEVNVAVSIGGAVTRGGLIDGVLRAADDALYQAKSCGRNRVVVHEQESTMSAAGEEMNAAARGPFV